MTKAEIVESLKSIARVLSVMKEDQSQTLKDKQWDRVSMLFDDTTILQEELQEELKRDNTVIPLDPNEYWKKFRPEERKYGLVNQRVLKEARFKRQHENKAT